jgi:hypothetical protein
MFVSRRNQTCTDTFTNPHTSVHGKSCYSIIPFQAFIHSATYISLDSSCLTMLSFPTTTVFTATPHPGTEEMIPLSLDASPENEMQSFPMSRSSSSSTVDDPKDLPETPIRALVTLPVESPSTWKAGKNVSIPESTSDVCPLAPFPRRVRFVEEPFVRIIPGRQTLLTSEYVVLEVDGQRTGLWKSVMGIFQDPLGVDSVSLRSESVSFGVMAFAANILSRL